MTVAGKAEVPLQTAVPVPLCLPQISHELTRDRSCAPAVISRRLTASNMAWSAAFCDNSNTAHNFMARLADISLSRDPLPNERLSQSLCITVNRKRAFCIGFVQTRCCKQKQIFVRLHVTQDAVFAVRAPLNA